MYIGPSTVYLSYMYKGPNVARFPIFSKEMFSLRRVIIIDKLLINRTTPFCGVLYMLYNYNIYVY